MQKFYAGGFLFNPNTKNILLHLRDNQTKANPNTWAFFGGLSEGKEEPIDTFIREVKEELGILLEKNSIHTLRNYFNPDFGTQRYVFYSENLGKDLITLTEGKQYKWFGIKDAFRFNLSKRTREDLQYFTSHKG